ncbi:hypothetical protein BX659_11416 [Orenia metallireducens]|uniref:Probable queuosine precursor transporter n=1 Tax=Orenia metallireducens TaxID=1413210 RepID=A0A285HPD4_9FIRM|nr:queuosine precursor transporter [Orenia metallireducens]PRX27966.1 hypothetical protein BX659_11416 [Orenia metallireducens]SNY37585.1 hypothetical protein SAMN06265827_12243 [Orenia metallireducens]
MSNEVLWIILMVVNFTFILLSYKLFGKLGLLVWSGFAIVLANIQVLKTVELFGIVSTLGNIIYGTSFLATDILSEKYGKKEASKAVWIGFFALISATSIMWLCLKFIPHESDFINESLVNIFSIMPRITIASLIAYLAGQLHDVWAYHYWKEKFSKDSQLWIRNNLSTMVSQLIDSLLFTFIAFYGVFEFDIFIEILITTYFMKWLVAACDTPIVYLAKKIDKPIFE